MHLKVSYAPSGAKCFSSRIRIPNPIGCWGVVALGLFFSRNALVFRYCCEGSRHHRTPVDGSDNNTPRVRAHHLSSRIYTQFCYTLSQYNYERTMAYIMCCLLHVCLVIHCTLLNYRMTEALLLHARLRHYSFNSPFVTPTHYVLSSILFSRTRT